MITDDPVRDALDKMTRDGAAEDLRPHCAVCGDPIWEDEAIEYNGKWYCADCEDDAWRKIRKEYLTKT